MNDRFLRACRRDSVDCTPIWFMRQAGRHFPEYRKLREKHSILSICKTPELTAKVTLLPVERLGVDAAIIFSDIMLPLESMGVSLNLEEGVGPIIKNPIRSHADVERLRTIDPTKDIPFLLSAIQIVKKLDRKTPLIGFSGGPFTLASYLIEGRPTRDFLKTKAFMYKDREAWHSMMEKLTSVVISCLRAEIQSGADAVQLFDSWVGCLGPQDYEELVLPYSRKIFEDLASTGVPRIHFGTGTATLLEMMAEAGADVLGVDWRINIDEAWRRVGSHVAVQGNLDPALMLGDFENVEARAKDILNRASGRPGHIFNLGHGVVPGTSPESLARLVKLVHESTMR